jgi:hypothetical protein
VENVSWYNIRGPYTTQAAANAAIPAIQRAAPAPGEVQQLTGVSFGSIEQALTAFYDVLTNGKMWRSLGWLVLGIVLMVAGLGWWLKGATPAGQIVSALR